MDKYFVCLANSYKRGGRCVAGVEIALDKRGNWVVQHNDNGTPHWIRPIAETTQYGEIPTAIAENIKLLSVVKLKEAKPCPENAQTENCHFQQIEYCQLFYPSTKETLDFFTDAVHQSIFGNRGKAIAAQMLYGINHSLLLIHPNKVEAYIDEEREKSKYRMKFNFYDTEYDFPITDPIFLERFKEAPSRYQTINEAYLTISLGMEFEGWHHKLVATVIIPSDTQETPPIPVVQQISFEEIEKRLAELLDKKDKIEMEINQLRMQIRQVMESKQIDQIDSQHFTIKYIPSKTIMQFDSKSFKMDNEELYSNYCRQKLREASIIVKRIKRK